MSERIHGAMLETNFQIIMQRVSGSAGAGDFKVA
jgi:hypothetical protein